MTQGWRENEKGEEGNLFHHAADASNLFGVADVPPPDFTFLPSSLLRSGKKPKKDTNHIEEEKKSKWERCNLCNLFPILSLSFFFLSDDCDMKKICNLKTEMMDKSSSLCPCWAKI